MARTWIIMHHELPSKPQVKLINRLTGARSIPLTIGRLFTVWVWADTHSEDGVMRAEFEDVDEEAGCEGFAQAMLQAGWLDRTPDGMLVFPDFGDHNGQTAKTRAANYSRKQRERAKNEVRHTDVTPKRDKGTQERENVTLPRDHTKQNSTKQDIGGCAASSARNLTPEQREQSRVWNLVHAAAADLDVESLGRHIRKWKVGADDSEQAATVVLDRFGAYPSWYDWSKIHRALDELQRALSANRVRNPVGFLVNLLDPAAESPEGAEPQATKTRGRRFRAIVGKVEAECENPVVASSLAAWLMDYLADHGIDVSLVVGSSIDNPLHIHPSVYMAGCVILDRNQAEVKEWMRTRKEAVR